MVAQLSRAFTREALKDGVVCEVIDSEEELPASLLLSVTGDQAEAFVSARVGTIQWIGESPFRPRHKRRNWFVGVNIAPSPDAMPDLRDEDIVFQTMRASGPGGQHVNKTDSAVRATHKPTGLIVTAQEQRSQHANRKLARQKLAALLDAQREKAGDNARQAQWSTHQNLERGKAVRTYTGPLFALKSPR
ncbi:peptide chain release factor H [Asticcacaulis currens]